MVFIFAVFGIGEFHVQITLLELFSLAEKVQLSLILCKNIFLLPTWALVVKIISVYLLIIFTAIFMFKVSSGLHTN